MRLPFESPEPYYFIDLVWLLKNLSTFSESNTSRPSQYIDLEGVSLSRQGTVSILQILVSPLSRTYLIHVHTLLSRAFRLLEQMAQQTMAVSSGSSGGP
jgi:exonuclease 3'-5' domain-containing protein 1